MVTSSDPNLVCFSETSMVHGQTNNEAIMIRLRSMLNKKSLFYQICLSFVYEKGNQLKLSLKTSSPNHAYSRT